MVRGCKYLRISLWTTYLLLCEPTKGKGSTAVSPSLGLAHYKIKFGTKARLGRRAKRRDTVHVLDTPVVGEPRQITARPP